MNTTSPLLVLFLIALVIERVLEIVSPFIGRSDVMSKRQAEMKALILFLVGSVLGGVICFVGKVNLFALCGLPLSSDTLAYLLSGICVGGGSKPLHDLISSLSKYRDILRARNGVVKG